MNIVQVARYTTLVLPDEGSEEFKSLYDGWYAEEGKYIEEDNEPLPEGDTLLEYLAMYVVTAAQSGDLVQYISTEDDNAKVFHDDPNKSIADQIKESQS